MRFSALLLALVSVASILLPSAFCQDEEAQQRWEQAKETYREQVKNLKKAVIDQVTALENKARERGDADKVKKYKQEREAFEENGQLPSSESIQAEYRKQLRTAQNQLREIFKITQTAYLKARLDTEAEDLNGEFEELIAAATAPSDVKPEDMRASGALYLNATYGGFWQHAGGKQWNELNAKKEVGGHFTELARTRDYVEIKRQENIPGQRANQLRLYSNRVEFKNGDKWEWCANGRWLTAK